MSSKGLGRGLDALLRRTDMGAARQEKNDTPEKETGTEHSPTLLPPLGEVPRKRQRGCCW